MDIDLSLSLTSWVLQTVQTSLSLSIGLVLNSNLSFVCRYFSCILSDRLCSVLSPGIDRFIRSLPNKVDTLLDHYSHNSSVFTEWLATFAELFIDFTEIIGCFHWMVDHFCRFDDRFHRMIGSSHWMVDHFCRFVDRFFTELLAVFTRTVYRFNQNTDRFLPVLLAGITELLTPFWRMSGRLHRFIGRF